MELIKEDVKNSKFNGEGYLKVKKRLAKTNKHIAKHRVNTLKSSLVATDHLVRFTHGTCQGKTIRDIKEMVCPEDLMMGFLFPSDLFYQPDSQ